MNCLPCYCGEHMREQVQLTMELVLLNVELLVSLVLLTVELLMELWYC